MAVEKVEEFTSNVSLDILAKKRIKPYNASFSLFLG